MNHKLLTLSQYIIKSISFLVLLYLLCVNVFKNSYVSLKERSTIMPANVLKHLLLCFVLLLVFLIVKHAIDQIEARNFNILFRYAALCIGFFLIVCVLINDFYPLWDQAKVFDIALQLRAGDFSQFYPDGYVGRYHQQLGMVLYIYILSFIFGTQCIKIIQILNIFALLSDYYLYYKISGLIFKKYQNTNRLSAILFALFIPYSYYITFVYGNVIGHTLAMLAIYLVCIYFTKKKLPQLIAAAVVLGLSVTFKKNFLVFFIGVALYIIFDLIKNFRKKYFLNLIVFLGIFIVMTKIPILYIENKTDIALDQGCPSVAWLEMGLTSHTKSDYPFKKGYFGPGWYNGYNREIYNEANFNSEKTKALVRKDLKETLSYYREHPSVLLSFLNEKNITQWCNPDFQGTWLLRRYDFFDGGSLYRECGAVQKIYNVFNSVIIFLSLLYLTVCFKRTEPNEMILLTIFIGGFIFHTAWEAKAQYTVSYFILLFPYAAAGLQLLQDRLIRQCFRSSR